MARRGSKEYEVVFSDHHSGSEIVFYYRMPTTVERLAFSSKFTALMGGTPSPAAIDEFIDNSLDFLTGIRDGDFERDEAGAWVVVSSNPESEHYLEGWKDWLKENAYDLLDKFAMFVFKGASVVSSGPRGDSLGK